MHTFDDNLIDSVLPFSPLLSSLLGIFFRLIIENIEFVLSELQCSSLVKSSFTYSWQSFASFSSFEISNRGVLLIDASFLKIEKLLSFDPFTIDALKRDLLLFCLHYFLTNSLCTQHKDCDRSNEDDCRKQLRLERSRQLAFHMDLNFLIWKSIWWINYSIIFYLVIINAKSQHRSQIHFN